MAVCVLFFAYPPGVRHGGATVGGGGIKRDSDAVCRRRPPGAVPVVLPLPSHGVAHRRDVSVGACKRFPPLGVVSSLLK